jgi:uncharacterized membrane protein
MSNYSKLPLAATAVVLAALVLAPDCLAADSALTICNNAGVAVTVAVVYQRSNNPAGVLNLDGWFRVGPKGDCGLVWNEVLSYGYVGIFYKHPTTGELRAVMLDGSDNFEKSSKSFCVAVPTTLQYAAKEEDLQNCDGRSGWYRMPFSLLYRPGNRTRMTLTITFGTDSGVPFIEPIPGLRQGNKVMAGELQRQEDSSAYYLVRDHFPDTANFTERRDAALQRLNQAGGAAMLRCSYATISPSWSADVFFWSEPGPPAGMPGLLQSMLGSEHASLPVLGPAKSCPPANPRLSLK